MQHNQGLFSIPNEPSDAPDTKMTSLNISLVFSKNAHRVSEGYMTCESALDIIIFLESLPLLAASYSSRSDISQVITVTGRLLTDPVNQTFTQIEDFKKYLNNQLEILHEYDCNRQLKLR